MKYLIKQNIFAYHAASLVSGFIYFHVFLISYDLIGQTVAPLLGNLNFFGQTQFGNFILNLLMALLFAILPATLINCCLRFILDPNLKLFLIGSSTIFIIISIFNIVYDPYSQLHPEYAISASGKYSGGLFALWLVTVISEMLKTRRIK